MQVSMSDKIGVRGDGAVDVETFVYRNNLDNGIFSALKRAVQIPEMLYRSVFPLLEISVPSVKTFRIDLTVLYSTHSLYHPNYFWGRQLRASRDSFLASLHHLCYSGISRPSYPMNIIGGLL